MLKYSIAISKCLSAYIHMIECSRGSYVAFVPRNCGQRLRDGIIYVDTIKRRY